MLHKHGEGLVLVLLTWVQVLAVMPVVVVFVCVCRVLKNMVKVEFASDQISNLEKL